MVSGTAPAIQSARFQDFTEYCATIEHADMRMTLPQLQCERWRMRFATLARAVEIQAGSEGSGTIAEGATRDDGTNLFYLNAGHCLANGHLLVPGAIFVLPPGAEFLLSAEGGQEWASVFLPHDVARSIGLDLDARSARVLELGATGRHVASLVERIVTSATRAPAVLSERASLVSLTEDLVTTCASLREEERVAALPRRGRRAQVDLGTFRLALDRIADASDLAVTLQDLVEATGLPERTLRATFQKFVGVSPRRYLQIQRLHRARGMLSDRDRTPKTVTEVATTLGLWDFGRFAGRYRDLFGESPSHTLRRTQLS